MSPHGGLIDDSKAWLSKTVGGLVRQILWVHLDDDQIPLQNIPAVTSPVITNVSAPTANTEVSHSIPDGTRKILVRVRDLTKAQVAFVSSESGTKFVTIPRGATLTMDDLNTSSLILYIQTDKASQVIEVMTWN